MGKVSIKEKQEKDERKITLKSWYQQQVTRMGHKNEIIDFTKYGPLGSFYLSARAKYGGELALKKRSEWNKLYKEFKGASS